VIGVCGGGRGVVQVVCCCGSQLVYTVKRPVATGSNQSFLFLSNLGTGNQKNSGSGQLQLVVWSFAVGFSSVLVIFLVQSTGPGNTN